MNKCFKLGFNKYIIAIIGLCLFALQASAQATTAELTNKVAENSLWNSPLFWVFVFAIFALLMVIFAIGAVLVGLVNNKISKSAKNITSIILLMLTFGIGSAQAQTATVSSAIGGLDKNTIVVLLIVVAIEFLVIVYLYSILQKMMIALGYKKPKVSSFSWTAIYKNITEAVPAEKEAEIATDHNYDGIIELDNSLPPWWIYMFYATICFAVIYLVYFNYFDGPNQKMEYDQEMSIAAVQKTEMLKTTASTVDETSVTLLADAESISKGRTSFVGKCAVCHGQNGEGIVGPNLTDDSWINGGSIKDIFKTIKYGKAEKGMIAWENQLKPLEMQQLASYIKSIHGSNPANPKAAQGEIYVEEKAVDTSMADTTSKLKANLETTKVETAK